MKRDSVPVLRWASALALAASVLCGGATPARAGDAEVGAQQAASASEETKQAEKALRKALRYCVSIQGSRAPQPYRACDRKLEVVARQGDKVLPIVLGQLEEKLKRRNRDEWEMDEALGVLTSMLGHIKTPAATAALMALLDRQENSSHPALLWAVNEALGTATGVQMKVHGDSHKERTALVQKWKTWWEANKADSQALASRRS